MTACPAYFHLLGRTSFYIAGKIPAQLCKFESLEIIDLSTNELEGEWSHDWVCVLCFLVIVDPVSVCTLSAPSVESRFLQEVC